MSDQNKLGQIKSSDSGATKPEDKGSNIPFLSGTLAVVFLGAICCGGPLIFGAVTLAASGAASTLGVAWPLAVGLGIGLLLALIGLRIYLRQRRRTRPTSSAGLSPRVTAGSVRKQAGSDLNCCGEDQVKSASHNQALQKQPDKTSLTK